MLVYRFTYTVRRGCMKEVVALNKEWEGLPTPPHARRIYSPRLAPHDVIVIEYEFESLGEYERYWNEVGSAPGVASFVERWRALTEPRGTHEIWQLEE